MSSANGYSCMVVAGKDVTRVMEASGAGGGFDDESC
jgi:hypothetical protein